MLLKFDKLLYPKSVLIKSAYSFTDRAYIHLDEDKKYYTVTIEFKPDRKFNIKDFENEMLCQAARYEIYLQTKELRKLTVARALASTVIDESDELNENITQEEYNMDCVLKDWFDNE